MATALAPHDLQVRIRPPEARRAQLRAAAAWLCANAPDIRDAILRTAESARCGNVTISGSCGEPCDIGTPPAWKEIRTRDSHYGSDLHRMLHWHALLNAFLMTEDARYAQRVVMEAQDWIASCPRPPLPQNREESLASFYGVSAEVVPWHCLNSGIRLFETWRFMLEVLAGTEHLPQDALSAIGWSMRGQAEAIRAVSPKLFPDAHHNHYLMEMLGVLSWARLFPDMPDAREWGTFAASELGRCALSQLVEDGAQVEGCPSYHSGCMYWFCLARQYAADCGTPLCAEADARIRNGIRWAVQATRPFGEDVPWGDSHAQTGFLRSAFLGYVAFGDTEPLAMAARFVPPEALRKAVVGHLWDAPDPDGLVRMIEAPGFSTQCAPWPATAWQRGVNQVSLRAAWEPAAAGVFFACYTPVHYGNHAHIDPCGFEFSALGRTLLMDPGCAAYFANETRRRIKSATAHNMLTVNFREPFDYCSSFAYAPQKEGYIDWVSEGALHRAAQGRHTCFDPAMHRRAVVLVDGRLLVVLDDVTELYWLSSVQLYFQLPFATVRKTERGFFTEEAGVNLALATAGDAVFGEAPVRTEADAAVGIEHPFTTIRFDDWGTSQRTERMYATAALPVEAGRAAGNIHVGIPQMERCDDGIHVRVDADGQAYRIIWTDTGVTVTRD